MTATANSADVVLGRKNLGKDSLADFRLLAYCSSFMESAANVAQKNKRIFELYQANAQQFTRYAQKINSSSKEFEKYQNAGRAYAAKVWREDIKTKQNLFLVLVHACENDGFIIISYVIDGNYNEQK